MQKKSLALVLALVTLLALFPLGVWASESYVVEVYNEGTTGFTYIYDSPDASKGTKLGKLTTGTYITVYRNVGKWFQVKGTTTDNKKVYGYILKENATPEAEYPARAPQNVYVINCFYASCPGYCYIYDKASSIDGKNIGRFNNGTEVTYLGTSGGWLKVTGVNTKGKTVTGYIHDFAAVPYEEYYNTDDEDNYEEWVIDCTSRNKKYCYIYDKKSSTEGKNLGSLNNGTVVYLVTYGSSWLYVKATTARGKTVMGYIHTWCAHPNFD